MIIDLVDGKRKWIYRNLGEQFLMTFLLEKKILVWRNWRSSTWLPIYMGNDNGIMFGRASKHLLLL